MSKSRLSAGDISKDFQEASRQSADARYLHRLHCVKLVQAGCDVADVGRWYDRPSRTIERWVRQYADNGGAGLVDKPRAGRPRTVDDELVSALLRDMQCPPSVHGLSGKSWTGVMLRDLLLQRYEATLSLRQSQRLLKRLQNGEEDRPVLRAVS